VAGESPLTPDEEVLRQMAVALYEHDHDAARRHIETVISQQGVSFGVGALLLASRYIAHAAVTRAVGITSPVPSIFELEGGVA
jgi:hypothetical protein